MQEEIHSQEVEEEALRAIAALGNPISPIDSIRDALNAFTRTKMRGDSFYRRIIPPIMITNDELDRSVSNNPQKIGY